MSEADAPAGPRPEPDDVDRAVLGGPPQRVGTFEYRYDTDAWTWSDAVFRIHGYEPGDVRPTTELVLSHKHPDDLENVKARLLVTAAPFASRHRITTATGEERTVVVVGEPVHEGSRVVATRGFYIDVTRALDEDVQEGISERLDDILANRAEIDQAKGMLMAVYDLDADAAFEILRWRSQEMNTKLLTVARRLIAGLPARLNVGPDARKPIDHLLMTLDHG